MANFVERIPWHGWVKVIARYRDGRVEVDEFPNLITNAGKNLLRDVLDGTVTDGAIKYLAIGTSSTAPAATDTKLGAEVFRKQITKQEVGAAGVLTTTTYVAPYEANVSIQELGWFAGASATSAKDSGILVARVLYARAKTELESLEIVRTDTIG